MTNLSKVQPDVPFVAACAVCVVCSWIGSLCCCRCASLPAHGLWGQQQLQAAAAGG